MPDVAKFRRSLDLDSAVATSTFVFDEPSAPSSLLDKVQSGGGGSSSGWGFHFLSSSSSSGDTSGGASNVNSGASNNGVNGDADSSNSGSGGESIPKEGFVAMRQYHHRESFASNPDGVIAVRLRCSRQPRPAATQPEKADRQFGSDQSESSQHEETSEEETSGLFENIGEAEGGGGGCVNLAAFLERDEERGAKAVRTLGPPPWQQHQQNRNDGSSKTASIADGAGAQAYFTLSGGEASGISWTVCGLVTATSNYSPSSQNAGTDSSRSTTSRGSESSAEGLLLKEGKWYYEIAQAAEVVVLLAAATSYRHPSSQGEEGGGHHTQACAATLEKASTVQGGYDGLKRRHIDDYRSLFHRVGLEINTGTTEADAAAEEVAAAVAAHEKEGEESGDMGSGSGEISGSSEIESGVGLEAPLFASSSSSCSSGLSTGERVERMGRSCSSPKNDDPAFSFNSEHSKPVLPVDAVSGDVNKAKSEVKAAAAAAVVSTRAVSRVVDAGLLTQWFQFSRSENGGESHC